MSLWGKDKRRERDPQKNNKKQKTKVKRDSTTYDVAKTVSSLDSSPVYPPHNGVFLEHCGEELIQQGVCISVGGLCASLRLGSRSKADHLTRGAEVRLGL